MNRRSLLGLLGLSPIVAITAAVAKPPQFGMARGGVVGRSYLIGERPSESILPRSCGVTAEQMIAALREYDAEARRTIAATLARHTARAE